MKKLIWILASFLSLCASAAEEIELATQYNYAPFSATDELNTLLAKRLTELSGGKYTFRSSEIPRRRIDVMLAENKSLVVPWVHPRFFGDKDKTKYLWSDALLSDVSYYVSPADKPLEYVGPESLSGKRFSGSFGHIYGDLAPMIDAGKIVREDAPTLRESLMKLVKGNRGLDFAVIDRSTLRALKDEPFVDPAKLYVSKKLRTEQFTRHILVPKNHPEWLEYINKTLTQLQTDKAWTAAISKVDSESRQ